MMVVLVVYTGVAVDGDYGDRKGGSRRENQEWHLQ